MLPDAVARVFEATMLPTPRAADGKASMHAPAARQHVADGNGSLAEVLGVVLLPTPSVADGTGGHTSRSGPRKDEPLLPTIAQRAADGTLLPTPRATDGTKGSPRQRGSGGDLMLPSAVLGAVDGSTPKRGDQLNEVAVRLMPTPEAKLGTSGPDYARAGRLGSGGHDLTTAVVIDWGAYAPAIARQETWAGPAPHPVEPTARGKRRLACAFVEWMMGLPAGWVTKARYADGRPLSRNDQLTVLGNGVMPAQAIYAFARLRQRLEAGET